jgi:tRNA nucleotidyltransferase/poly(A) polymerase
VTIIGVMMKIFLVGGAVRDELMGQDVTDRDFVVTGSDVSTMLKLGYTQVGKDFPVFIHPETGEEYALARQERKISLGHDGFQFDFSPETPLETDLMRRDLTINAIAKDDTGEYIDPYNGRGDINKKILRHVSSAFVEDPLRVLRVCRFKAKFPSFKIDDSTFEMMKSMIFSKDFSALSKHRNWQELSKTLQYQQPEHFFYCLTDLEFLPKSVIDHLTVLTFEKETSLIKFSCMLHHPDMLSWVNMIFSPPNEYIFLASKFNKYKKIYNKIEAQELLNCFKDLRAFTNTKWIKLYLQCGHALYGKDLDSLLLPLLEELTRVSAADFPHIDPGPELGEAIEQRRLEIITRSIDAI